MDYENIITNVSNNIECWSFGQIRTLVARMGKVFTKEQLRLQLTDAGMETTKSTTKGRMLRMIQNHWTDRKASRETCKVISSH